MELYYPTETIEDDLFSKEMNVKRLARYYDLLRERICDVWEKGYSHPKYTPEIFSYFDSPSILVVRFPKFNEETLTPFLNITFPKLNSVKAPILEYSILDSALNKVGKKTEKGLFEFLFSNPRRRIVDIEN